MPKKTECTLKGSLVKKNSFKQDQVRINKLNKLKNVYYNDVNGKITFEECSKAVKDNFIGCFNIRQISEIKNFLQKYPSMSFDDLIDVLTFDYENRRKKKIKEEEIDEQIDFSNSVFSLDLEKIETNDNIE